MATKTIRKHLVTFGDACSLVRQALGGDLRAAIVSDAVSAKTFPAALLRIGEQMRSNHWRAAGEPLDLDRVVRQFDRLTREEGFHVLHDWDGKAARVNPDTIPVDVLRYAADARSGDVAETSSLATIVDYYFLNLLALLSLRAWDDGDADANLELLGGLLRDLQGTNGSGERFASDAETLLLVATCHYEPEEHGYELLLDRVRGLNAPHRVRVALGHASSMGSHLRFGFEATYARDPAKMRDDNAADYPWLGWALATLIAEYARLHDAGVIGPDRDALVEALANGLSADPKAFLDAGGSPERGGTPPGAAAARERAQLGELFHAYGRDLLEEFERCRPAKDAYTPFAFFFNFAHNVIKGTVVDALLWGEPWRVSFNDLLTARSTEGAPGETKKRLANTLMTYARSHPDRIGGRLMPVIVYDPIAGHQAFAGAMRTLRHTLR